VTSRSTTVRADLRFHVETEGREPVTGSLTGEGSDLTLTVSDPAAFAGGGDAHALRRVADELAGLGLRLRVADGTGRGLLRLGAVRSPWWQRPLTHSAHMRVGGLRGLLAAGRGRFRDGGTLPVSTIAPPTTPYPLAPTFLRRPVRRVTTTHDPGRGGGPRLVEVPGDRALRSDHPVHWLQQEVTTIGSDPSCDVVLPGLSPRHAEVRHDERDEYVVVALDPDVRVHGVRVTEKLLRTASRIDLADRQLVFHREEYADHGRPYGGRIGGELGHQRPQPPRASEYPPVR
jgi:hypothetical protein